MGGDNGGLEEGQNSPLLTPDCSSDKGGGSNGGGQKTCAMTGTFWLPCRKNLETHLICIFNQSYADDNKKYKFIFTISISLN